MKKLLQLLFVPLVVIAGCALPKPGVSTSLLEQVDKGAEQQEVVRLFGQPHYRYAKGNTKFLLYGIDEDGDGNADTRNRIVLMFVEGKLYDKGVDVYGEGESTKVEEAPAVEE